MMKKGIIEKIIDYGQDVYQDEVEKAIDIFFNKDDKSYDVLKEKDVNMLFNEWLVFDYKLSNGETLLENYLQKNLDNLPKNIVDECVDLLQNIYSIFKVKKVWKEKGLRLEDLISGKEFDVKEISLTRQVGVGDYVFLRIVKSGDDFEIASGNVQAIKDINIDKKYFSEINEGDLTPKYIYELFNKRKELEVMKEEMLEEWNRKIDPKVVQQNFKDFLAQNNLDEFVSFKLVQDWIKNMGTKNSVMRDITDIIFVFEGLLIDNKKHDQKMEELLALISDLSNITQQVQLNNQSPYERKTEEPERSPEFDFTEREMTDWKGIQKYLDDAMDLMKKLEFKQSQEEIEKGLKKCLDSRAIYKFGYRVIANYATCLLMEEKYDLALEFIKMSLDLNSNYTFGKSMFKKIEDAQKMEMYERMNLEDRYDADEIENKWSEKKILNEFKSLGLNINKDEFMKASRKDFELEKYWQSKLLPELKDSELSRKESDEDFLWMGTYALWKLNKKDNDFVQEHLLDVMRQLESACHEDDLNYDKINKILDELQLYADKAPDKVIEGTFKYQMEFVEFIDYLVWLLGRDEYADKIYKLTIAFEKRTKNDLFKIFSIFCKIEDDKPWKREYGKIVKKNKYCILIPLLTFDFLNSLGVYENIAEEILKDALKIVQLREKDKIWDTECYTKNNIYRDYEAVFNYMKDFYSETKNKQGKDEVKKLRKDVESRKEELSYSKRDEKLDKALEELDLEEKRKLEKKIGNNSVKLYYDFLKKTKINFKTKEKTKDELTQITSEKVRKVGRNDPCPCGSGKKYKKCCL